MFRLLLLVGLFITNAVVAQQKDSSYFSKADTLIDKVKSVKLPTSKADSLQKKWSAKSDSLNKLGSKLDSKLDSIESKNIVTRYSQKADSLQVALYGKLQGQKDKILSRIDSLKSLKLPTAALEAGLQKMNGSLDSLKSKIKLPDISKATGKVQAKAAQIQTNVLDKANLVTTKTTEKITGLQNGVNQKITTISGGQLKGLDANLKLPQTSLPSLPNSIIPGISNVPIPGAQLPSNPLNSNQLPGVPNTNIPGTGNIPSLSTGQNGNIPQLPQANQPNLSLPNASQYTNQASGYTNEAKNIVQGNLNDAKNAERLAEAEAKKMREVKKLQEQTDAVQKYREQAERYNDPVAMEKEVKQKATEVATGQLAAQQKNVNEAVQNLSKQKAKYGNIQSINDLPKRRFNAMRDKPFVERLVLGITFQIQSGTNFWLDVNPSLGYRFNGRLSAGLGWNERVAANFNKGNYFIESDRIYGLRSYAQYRVGSKLMVRAELESMNTKLRPLTFNPLGDRPTRGWVWSCFVGIKQDFKISKKLNGNAQILYNVYNPDNQSPYNERLNLRFGLEWPLVKSLSK